ncbi:MAG: 30S ribosome-binding factor RbfA [Lacipirellulaceae bacterium]
MSSRRVLKAAEAVREVVSLAILTDLRDPRVQNVTVTHVEVAGDMRGAKVYVSVMGDEAKQRLAIRGLESSAGYLQSRLAERIDTRYTPKLHFELDQGIKKSIAIARMLAEVLPTDVAPTDAAPTNDPDSNADSTTDSTAGVESDAR